MFAENLAPFFDTAEFGSAATVNGASVNGIFDNDYFEPLGNDVAGRAPRFLCAHADVVAVAQGDPVVIDSVSYKVRGIEPDGTGLVLLHLEQQ